MLTINLQELRPEKVGPSGSTQSHNFDWRTIFTIRFLNLLFKPTSGPYKNDPVIVKKLVN